MLYIKIKLNLYRNSPHTEKKTSQTTVPIAPPAIPAAPAPYAAIPPAPTNQGPAPADTVTVTKIAAPVRTHTRITPQVTRIEPEIQVNKYEVEVPVAVPVPVEREVIGKKKLIKISCFLNTKSISYFLQLKNMLQNLTLLKYPNPMLYPNPTKSTQSNML